LKKKVIVTIESKQKIENSEEVIELVTPGDFYCKENAYYLVYDETEISGMEGTTTTLRAENGYVNLIRFGSTNSNLKFREGIKDVSLYRTPYGVLEIAIIPSIVKVDINESGGEIKLIYELDFGGPQRSKNELHIKVAPERLKL